MNKLLLLATINLLGISSILAVDRTSNASGSDQASSSNATPNQPSSSYGNGPSITPNKPQKLDEVPEDAFGEIGKFLDPKDTQNLSLTSPSMRKNAQKTLLENASQKGVTFDFELNHDGIVRHTVDDVISFLKQSNEKKIQNIKLILNNIDLIGSSYYDLTVSDLDEILELCDNVSDLTIGSSFLTDNHLQHIAQTSHLRNLRRLKVDFAQSLITSIGIQAISGLSQLTHLSLSGISILDNTAMSYLKNMNNLTSFTLYNYPDFMGWGLRHIDPAALIDTISGMPDLQELVIPGTRINDEQLKKLLNLKLIKLEITDGEITETGIRDIANSKLSNTLKILTLNRCSITNAGFQILTEMKNLDGLELKGNQISVIPDLSSFQNLKILALSNNQIDDNGLQGIESGQNLKELDLSRNPISDIYIRMITKLPELIRLNLSQTGITDRSARFLAQSPKLKSLDVSFNMMITLRGIKILAESYNRFEFLGVSGTNIDDSSGQLSLTFNDLKDKFPFIHAIPVFRGL